MKDARTWRSLGIGAAQLRIRHPEYSVVICMPGSSIASIRSFEAIYELDFSPTGLLNSNAGLIGKTVLYSLTVAAAAAVHCASLYRDRFDEQRGYTSSLELLQKGGWGEGMYV